MTEDNELFYWCMGCQTVVRIERYHKGHTITIVDYKFLKRVADVRDRLGIEFELPRLTTQNTLTQESQS